MKMRSKTRFALFLILLSISTTVSAQMIGGTSTGQMAPKEASAGSIVAGGVSGDVNLFSGTFNASYDLGSVSTLSGLGFSLSMSYNSTFATGDNVPTLTGVPYGEGWSLNVPTISVSSEAYSKYSAQQRRNMSGARKPVYLAAEAEEEGDLYWFDPVMNIPGVGGGRMVLKRTIAGGNKHVFVLHKFERYIEAIFDGSKWEVIMDDGTRYEFSPYMKAHREASNQRVHPETACSSDYNPAYAGTSSLVMPKTEYLSWYCTSIWHPDLVGKITFGYNYYGEDIDFFKRYKQDIHYNARDFIDDADIGGNLLPKVYRDVHLALVKSDYERLLLDYSLIDQTNASGLLNPSDSEVVNLDDLYCKSMVYSTNGNDFDDWYRYRHIKTVSPEDQISSQNPYLRVGSVSDNCNYNGVAPEGEYWVEQAVNGEVNHSFLESPRLSPFDVNPLHGSGNTSDQLYMPPGEIYEVKATISGGYRAALFDINIASGDFTIPHNMPSSVGNSEWLPACEFADTRGHSIHSTFGKALKWHASDANNMDANISEFFVLPNNPRAYAGFNIQIGPANSDNNYAKLPVDMISASGVPYSARSYYNLLMSYGDGPLLTELYGDNDANNHSGFDMGLPVVEPQTGLYPTDRIGNNFGIGLPWHNMLDFYAISDIFGLTMCPEESSPQFWWNSSSSMPTYENKPTAADDGYRLYGVELWRYSKKPLMLTGVRKENFIGIEIITTAGGGWTNVANLSLNYSIDVAAITNSVVHNGAAINELTGYNRNVVRLNSIKVMPTEGSGETGEETNYPTTHFEYDDAIEYIRLGDNINSFYFNNDIDDPSNPMYVNGDMNQESYLKVLRRIINPLGQITTIHYQPIDNEEGTSYATLKYLGGDGLDFTPPRFYNKPLGEETYKVPGYALQAYLVVKDKEVAQKAGEVAKWSYIFSGKRAYNSSTPLLPNLRFSDPDKNKTFGFGNATVYGPSLAANQGPRTTYVHHTNWLYWGKLTQTNSYDELGSDLSETKVSYDASVAFEPVQLRISPDYYGGDVAGDLGDYYSYWGNREPLPNKIYLQGNPDDYYSTYYNAIYESLEEESNNGIDCNDNTDPQTELLATNPDCYNLLFNRSEDDPPLLSAINTCQENLYSMDPSSQEYADCIELAICQNEYLSLSPSCFFGAFYDYSAFPPDIRTNEGGEFETPKYILGRSDFFH